MNKVNRNTQQQVVTAIAALLQQHGITENWHQLETLEMAMHYCAGSAATLGWQALHARSGKGALECESALQLIA